jgi:glycosyltransferase involved in cell wall biosynthesis
MLKAFTIMSNRKDIHLVVIGGNEEDVVKYKIAVAERGIDSHIHFIGPRPLSRLFDYLMQADILVSPRLSGQNTPMKIYSYLASGRPILATDIPSHNQVLDNSCSVVVKPEPQAIAKGLMRLAGNVDLCRRIGLAGQELVNTRYSYSEYRKKLLKAYATFNPDRSLQETSGRDQE